MTIPPFPKSRRPYGKLLLAGLFYMVGIAAFSLWSYRAQRGLTIGHMNQSLIIAAHATGQILGSEFLDETADLRQPDPESFNRRQQRLNGFARESGLVVLEAIAHKQARNYALICGEGAATCAADSSVKPGDPVPREVDAAITKAMRSESPAVTFSTMTLEPFGRVQVALMYEKKEGDEAIVFLVARNLDAIEKKLRNQALQQTVAALLLFLMAVPLAVLYNRMEKRSAKKLTDLNKRLQHDLELLEKRENELKDAVQDLERFGAATAGREGRILELKAEINRLLIELKREPRFHADTMD
jgi:hypothetical protein